MHEEKGLLLREIEQRLGESPAFFVARYGGIDPNLTYALRSAVRESGGRFCVVKKRLFLRAIRDVGMPLDRSALDGHIGVVYSEADPSATLKAICDFKGKNGDVIEMVGGYLDGKLCAPEEIAAISALPGREEMRGELLALFEAPLRQCVGVMEALLAGVVECLNQKIEGK